MDFVFLARIWNENHGPRGIWSFQLSELDTWESCIFSDGIPFFCEITIVNFNMFFKINPVYHIQLPYMSCGLHMET